MKYYTLTGQVQNTVQRIVMKQAPLLHDLGQKLECQ